ncbi:MAG: hypothetical protein NTZ74_06435 [Chloroflexi bacterium]|nr:hypothetical protein [Chloroflexota bacterium]
MVPLRHKHYLRSVGSVEFGVEVHDGVFEFRVQVIVGCSRILLPMLALRQLCHLSRRLALSSASLPPELQASVLATNKRIASLGTPVDFSTSLNILAEEIKPFELWQLPVQTKMDQLSQLSFIGSPVQYS